MANIGMIGAGSWGTALTYALSQNGHPVTMYSAIAAEVELLNAHHEQTEKLPGVKLPDTVSATAHLEEAVRGKDMLVLAVPSHFTRATAHDMAAYVEDGQIVVSVAKGIEKDSLKTLSEIILEEIPQCRVAVLCGPTHAEEVGRGLPTAIVAGAEDPALAEAVQEVFMNRFLRVYTSTDILGMQVGAALKNVIALAAGIADGLGYGDNTKAALITRGIAEITKVGVAMGGRAETFAGLTGIGDLIVTCASMHSRNRRAGILIGQGRTPEEAMEEVQQVVEGVFSAEAARELGERYGVDMPIVDGVCRVLFDQEAPADVVADLMLRERKSEV